MSQASASIQPTEEMINRFYVRTLRHIALVADNLVSLAGYLGLQRSALETRALAHDASKFDDSEKLGYVWLTWMYDCKAENRLFVVLPQIGKLIERCLRIHRERNSHHPEGHPSPNAMSALDLVEMVCDWTAIAQENDGVGSARVWAEGNLARWDFSRPICDFVFLTIDELDRRNLNRVTTSRRRPNQDRTDRRRALVRRS